MIADGTVTGSIEGFAPDDMDPSILFFLIVSLGLFVGWHTILQHWKS